MQEYLNNNATKDTFTEHPKEVILNEDTYFSNRSFYSNLNGGLDLTSSPLFM